MKNVLTVDKLTKQYRGSPRMAVEKVSFHVAPGETLGILGANGAGKTTTISMLLGLLTPSSGSITYFGKNFFKHRSEIMQQVGSATAFARLPSRLSIYRNLDIFGRLYGLDRKTRDYRINALLEKLGMLSMRDRLATGLSAGETTRIIIAKAFLHSPQIVLLDEPTASLDVDIAHTIRNFINDQREKGKSFIITSHNMLDMTELCDRIIVMEEGKISIASTPEQLARSVHNTKLWLLMGDQVEACAAFAKENNIPFVIDQAWIELEVGAQEIASTLLKLNKRSITYADIEIKHPTLEDYFIALQKKRRKAKAQK
ncbi:MAG: ABC transporter, ATPase subunit [candidate division TM6 bacterium GW2011_GWE2_42_60]|nr:MAG: ABC transporter, ATPase subunit [candidate division TM6 bacterium GW2011_GWE2_42_60]HBY05544.1 hypothetical protein [Candidatus Dependentiae bacterium]